jgi:ribosomal protein S19E (S16A)
MPEGDRARPPFPLHAGYPDELVAGERPELLLEGRIGAGGVGEGSGGAGDGAGEGYLTIASSSAISRRDLSTLAEMGIIAVKREGRLWRYLLNPSFRSLRTIADNHGQNHD